MQCFEAKHSHNVVSPHVGNHAPKPTGRDVGVKDTKFQIIRERCETDYAE